MLIFNLLKKSSFRELIVLRKSYQLSAKSNLLTKKILQRRQAFDENIGVFMVNVSFQEPKITIYLARQAQMALILAKKVTVLIKYSDFANVFLEKSGNVLLEQIDVNEYAITLEKSKQQPYGLIYSLEPVKLKSLKTYIKINLANNFIKASKSLASVLILFLHKPNGSFCFYVDYQRLNNLTIKN